MKHIWVRVDPWDKELAIAALEGGADAVVVAEGDAPRMKELGALPVVAAGRRDRARARRRVAGDREQGR